VSCASGRMRELQSPDRQGSKAQVVRVPVLIYRDRQVFEPTKDGPRSVSSGPVGQVGRGHDEGEYARSMSE
jgi:hypothetical protein